MPKSTSRSPSGGPASYVKRSIVLTIPVNDLIERFAEKTGESFSLALRELVRRGASRPSDAGEPAALVVAGQAVDHLRSVAARLGLPAEALATLVLEEGLAAWARRAEELEAARDSRVARSPKKPDIEGEHANR